MAYIEQKYLLPQDKTTEYLILGIALFLIIIVWSVILYRATYFGAGTTKALLSCPAGECPTNRFTGEKRCSKNSNLPVQYDPIYEVCNPSNECSAQQTPYALQANGSTNINGQCDVNGCNCVNFLSTPSYTEVLFNAQNGLFISSNQSANSKIVLNQQPSPYVGEGNNVPMTIKDPNSQFWSIGIGYLPFLNPNPCSDLYGDDPTVDIQTTLKCINRNPCLVGRLSYLPQDSSAFNSFTNDNLSSTVLACVPNSVENPVTVNSCQNNDNDDSGTLYAPVFNLSNGRVFCYNTGLTGHT